jgi:hypothetical protein
VRSAHRMQIRGGCVAMAARAEGGRANISRAAKGRIGGGSEWGADFRQRILQNWACGRGF